VISSCSRIIWYPFFVIWCNFNQNSNSNFPPFSFRHMFGSKPGSGIGTGKYLVIEGLWVQFILWWELWNLKICTYLLVRWLHRTNFHPIWFFSWPPGGRNQKYYLYYSWMAGSFPHFLTLSFTACCSMPVVYSLHMVYHNHAWCRGPLMCSIMT
jgi:hypothetical protein